MAKTDGGIELPEGKVRISVVVSVLLHTVSGRIHEYTVGESDVEIVNIFPDSIRVRMTDGTVAVHPINNVEYFHLVDKQEIVDKPDEVKENKKADQ